MEYQYHIGFTGSRNGMTSYQHTEVLTLLMKYAPKRGKNMFHHGDCLGADEEAHDIALYLCPATHIAIHPPKNPKYRAFCKDYTTILPEKDYIERNHDIVDASTIMIATPSGTEKEQPRSGTWATIRYAKKAGLKRLYVITPDGSVTEYV